MGLLRGSIAVILRYENEKSDSLSWCYSFFAYVLDILRIFSWDLASTRTFGRHDAKCSRGFDDRFPRGLFALIEKRLAV